MNTEKLAEKLAGEIIKAFSEDHNREGYLLLVDMIKKSLDRELTRVGKQTIKRFKSLGLSNETVEMTYLKEAFGL